MNIELSRNAVIGLIVVVVLLIAGIFWQVMRPHEVPLPKGYNPYGTPPVPPK